MATEQRLISGSHFGGLPAYSTIPIGGVAWASLGTDTTPVAGTTYYTSLFVPRYFHSSGGALLNGSAVSGKFIISLHDQNGVLLARSLAAGTNQAGTNVFQGANWISAVDISGPGLFWLGVQFDGTSARFRTIAASTYIDFFAASGTGSFGTTPTLTRTATATMTIATPCVVTQAAHGYLSGQTVSFTTTGALPTGVTASTTYYMTVVNANTYKLSTTLATYLAGTFIASSGTQSPTHTAAALAPPAAQPADTAPIGYIFL